jgi:hypothetical protein
MRAQQVPQGHVGEHGSMRVVVEIVSIRVLEIRLDDDEPSAGFEKTGDVTDERPRDVIL